MKITKKLLLFQKLIYVSSATRKKVIEQHHNEALIEHFKIDKIMKLISRNYYFLQMRQKIKNISDNMNNVKKANQDNINHMKNYNH